MLQTLLMILIFIFTIIFTQLKHPLSMGLLLLIQTTLISFISSYLNETYWFSYILFLIFMGGMLVLFIYVTSLASNETFSLSFNMLMISILTMFTCLLIFYIFYKMTFNNLFYNSILMINKENTFTLIKLFNYPTNLITIMLMNYLLITLITVVKITNIFYGPLRQMFN